MQTVSLTCGQRAALIIKWIVTVRVLWMKSKEDASMYVIKVKEKFKTIDEVNEYQQDIKIANEKKAAGL